MVLSTTAAGIINQTARGFWSLLTKSCMEEAPTALSLTNSSTAFGDISKTTQLWPALISRRTMLAPILPRPTIPSCIDHSLFLKKLLDPLGRFYFVDVITAPSAVMKLTCVCGSGGSGCRLSCHARAQAPPCSQVQR